MSGIELTRVVSCHTRAIKSYGSGYLVTPGVVLTASHCVGPVGSPVEVLALKPGKPAEGLTATPPADFTVAVVVGAQANGLALLESATADPFDLGDVPPVRWGWLAGMLPLPADTIGFPELADTGERLNAEHAVGRLIPVSGGREIRPESPETSSLGFHVESGTPDVNVGGGSLWRGASGAAVFSESHLIGVLGEYHPLMRGRLKVTPVARLVNDRDALGFLAERGWKAVSLEPVWAGDELLDPAYSELDSNWSAADLLRARYGIVGFSGRDKELQDLANWCADGRGVSIRLLTGDGAVGKTRLARELCDKMTRRGWIAGLLTSSIPGLERLQELDEDRLIVVDDADLRVGQVDALLAARSGPGKLRILAVARSGGRWWQTIERRYDKLLGESLVLESPDKEQRVQVYENAVSSFRQRELGRLPRTPVRPSRIVSAADLDDPDFDNYLFILILALIDVYRQLGEEMPQAGLAPSVTRAETLFEQVLDLERRDWVEAARAADLPSDPVLLDRVVAVASLAYAGTNADGRGENEAAACLRMVPDLRDASEYTRRRFVRMFSGRITGYDALRPLRPQRLAEYLVAKVVRQFPEIVEELLAPPGDRPKPQADAARQALNTLRLLGTDPGGDRGEGLPPQTADPGAETALHDALRKHAPYVVELARTMLGDPDDPTGRSLATALVTVFGSLPDNKIAASAAAKLDESCPDALLGLAVELHEKAIEFYQEQQESRNQLENLANRINLGNAHKRLSIALADSGRRREALDQAWQAVESFTSVVRMDNRDEHRLQKGHALSNLAVREFDVGQFEGSLEHGREAVRLYEDLIGSTHDRMHHVHLSFALRNLSQSYAQLGRSREALQAATEALDLVQRELPSDSADHSASTAAVASAKALAFRELAHRQADVGRRHEALESARQAHRLYQELADREPSRWRRDLARSLDVLGRRYADMTDWEESIVTLHEARDEYDRVEQEYQEAERGRHAELLRDLARSCLGLARAKPSAREDALEEGRRAADEALTLYGRMSRGDEIVQRASKGQTLRVRADVALEEQDPAAVDYAKEAVRILGNLVADRSWKGRRSLARAHAVYRRALAWSGDLQEAARQGQEAYALFRELDAEEPERVGTELQDAEAALGQYKNP